MVESFDQERQSLVESRGRWTVRLESTVIQQIGMAGGDRLLHFCICPHCESRLADFSLVGIEFSHRSNEKHSVVHAAGALRVAAKQVVLDREPATLLVQETEILA